MLISVCKIGVPSSIIVAVIVSPVTTPVFAVAFPAVMTPAIVPSGLMISSMERLTEVLIEMPGAGPLKSMRVTPSIDVPVSAAMKIGVVGTAVPKTMLGVVVERGGTKGAGAGSGVIPSGRINGSGAVVKIVLGSVRTMPIPGEAVGSGRVGVVRIGGNVGKPVLSGGSVKIAVGLAKVEPGGGRIGGVESVVGVSTKEIMGGNGGIPRPTPGSPPVKIALGSLKTVPGTTSVKTARGSSTSAEILSECE